MRKTFMRCISIVLSFALTASALPTQALSLEAKEPIESESSERQSTTISDGKIPAYNSSPNNTFEFSRLSGNVTIVDGNGLSGVSVWIYNFDEGTVLTTCTTNAQGYWTSMEYDVIAGYTYLISYYKAGYQFNRNNIKITALSGGTAVEPVTATLIEIPDAVCNEADYTYTTDTVSETATITGYTGADTAIELPAELGGYPVSAIAEGAFQNNTGLEIVVFSENIREVGTSVFQSCINLKEIYLPNVLEKIGNYAFYGCTGLESLELPDSVTTIGHRAFQGCSKLSAINYPMSLSSAGEYGNGSLFRECSNLTSITVPEDVTELAALVFEGSESLKEIQLPSTLLRIGDNAFEGCTGLEGISLPSGLEEIGNYAFYGCTGLESLELPDSVTTIGQRAFQGCSKLSAINYPMSLSSVGQYSTGSIFQGCSSLTSITVPEGVTMLPDLVFQGCNYLRTISLPQSLKTIGEYSFSDCVALRFVILPSSVSLLGDYAFYNCIDLRYVLVSNPDCLIGKEAFSNTPKMLLYSDINSLATVFAIENNVPYIASDVANLDHSGLLDRTSSNYFADTNSVNTNGHVAFTIDCEVPVNEWEATTQRSILIKVPSNTNPIESTLKINGEICTEYEYDEDEELITIAATEASTTIKYTSKIYSSDDLVSYALISYSKDGEQKQEVIGVIDEKYDAFTVNAVELTSQREISIDGAAPAGSKISIYVDNVLAATCNATKAGIYFSHVTLQGTSSEQVYVNSAKCEQTSGKTLNATTFVSFRQEAPTLTGFKFYINDDSAQMVDLYSYALHGIYPSITHTGSQYPYRFEVTFTNPEMIDAVFVTSTRNNIKNPFQLSTMKELKHLLQRGTLMKRTNCMFPVRWGSNII